VKREIFKDKIKHERMLGYWSILPLVQVHEILYFANFDFIIIDLEHGTYSFQDAAEVVSAVQSKGMYALIRPSSHDPKEILRCLELGVDGICIPQVSNLEQAKKIVNACMYPPLGMRGASGFTRATRYGQLNFVNHTKISNEQLFVSLLIEDREGLESATEIAELQGVDCIYFGTYDIASSLKINNQAGAEVNQIIQTSIDSIDNKGVVFGQVAVDYRQFNALDERINFVPCGVDCGIILAGAEKFMQELKK
jgi:2-keto-3-deoxy-L-rhamnonate aldolase RhmA